jgi:hypothetical protein
MDRAVLVRYGLRYAAWYLGASALLFILAMIIPAIGDSSGASAVLPLASAIAVHHQFLKDSRRHLEATEYWMLVALCSAVSLALQIALLTLLTTVGALPALPASAWLWIIPIALPLTVLPHMLAFARFMGARQLKAVAASPPR